MARFTLRSIRRGATTVNGIAVETHDGRFAVMRTKSRSRDFANELQPIVQAIGMPIVCIHVEDELELVEVAEEPRRSAGMWVAASHRKPPPGVRVLAWSSAGMHISEHYPDAGWVVSGGFSLSDVSHWAHVSEPEASCGAT